MAMLFDSWLVELAAVLAAFLAGFYVYCIFKFRYWKKKGVPYLTPSFPFGNIADMILVRKHISEVLRDMYEKREGHKVLGIYRMCSPTLLVNDPEIIKSILIKDFSHFNDHGTHFDEESNPLSMNLFAMEGKKWRHMRIKLTPTFTSGKMKMMFPAIVESGKEMQQYLVSSANRKEILVNLKQVIMKYTTDVIATCAFGIQCNSFQNPNSEFMKMGQKLFDPSILKVFSDVLMFFLPSIAATVKIPMFPREVTNFFRGVVSDTVKHRETNNIQRNDFMQLLIKIKNRKSVVDETEHSESIQNDTTSERNYYDVNGMTLDEVTAQAIVFFTGGMDTTSMTISFCLHELAVNPVIQERLQDEIDSVLTDFDGQLTYEGVVGMAYLDNVVAETLRKYSPAPTLMRVCGKEYKLPGSDVTIEKGTQILIPVSGLHYDAQYYPDPEKFDPDRFTEEVKSQRHHYVYLPFGDGPRSCIASRFALMQVKVGLVSLLAKYRFDVCAKTVIPLKITPKTIVTSPEGGINLKISARA